MGGSGRHHICGYAPIPSLLPIISDRASPSAHCIVGSNTLLRPICDMESGLSEHWSTVSTATGLALVDSVSPGHSLFYSSLPHIRYWVGPPPDLCIWPVGGTTCGCLSLPSSAVCQSLWHQPLTGRAPDLAFLCICCGCRSEACSTGNELGCQPGVLGSPGFLRTSVG